MTTVESARAALCAGVVAEDARLDGNNRTYCVVKDTGLVEGGAILAESGKVATKHGKVSASCCGSYDPHACQTAGYFLEKKRPAAATCGDCPLRWWHLGWFAPE